MTDVVPTAPLTDAATTGRESERGLRGSIGTPSVVFITLACMSPLTAAAGYLALVVAFGNGVGAPFMYLTVGVVAALFAVGFLAMVKDLARPGGLYAYITAGLGRLVGLGAGYVAIVTYLFAEVGLAIFGGISLSFVVSDAMGGPEIAWYWFALLFIVLATVAAYFNISLSAKLLSAILIVEILFVLAFDLVVLLNAGPANYDGAGASFSLSGLLSGSVALGFLFVLSQFSGFESPALYYEEMRDPVKSVPRATYSIIVIIAVMYCFTVWAIIVGFGASTALEDISADSSGAFAVLFSDYLSAALYKVCAIFIQTGILASLLAGNNLLSRYMFNMGVDGVLPDFLGRANRRTGSPATASVAVGGILFAIVVVTAVIGGDPNQLLALLSGTGTYGFLVLFLLGSVSVVFYFSRKRGVPAARRAVYIGTSLVTAGTFAAVIFYVSSNLSVLVGENDAFGVMLQVIIWAAFIVGAAYATYLSVRRRDIFVRIGRQEVPENI
ncbi:APC family permease [Salinibacterium sp. ZJ450]|uniref:APC family permease n=1 Tax=Salinibacterium sp. ZJ450 TaxID=2708338 RepID=UPI00142126D5|nr:APC family permease [Salinibacterium sp. ZJ450]